MASQCDSQEHLHLLPQDKYSDRPHSGSRSRIRLMLSAATVTLLIISIIAVQLTVHQRRDQAMLAEFSTNAAVEPHALPSFLTSLADQALARGQGKWGDANVGDVLGTCITYDLKCESDPNCQKCLITLEESIKQSQDTSVLAECDLTSIEALCDLTQSQLIACTSSHFNCSLYSASSELNEFVSSDQQFGAASADALSVETVSADVISADVISAQTNLWSALNCYC
mmetsp:Transcript_47210/g.64277  ORF Transcript_47210/g.64277 Transcript_47210/m.64277 type:complete len:227 (+) Transcript_47210:72-752(+)